MVLEIPDGGYGELLPERERPKSRPHTGLVMVKDLSVRDDGKGPKSECSAIGTPRPEDVTEASSEAER
jgi:hypothetical protein